MIKAIATTSSPMTVRDEQVLSFFVVEAGGTITKTYLNGIAADFETREQSTTFQEWVTKSVDLRGHMAEMSIREA